MSFVTQKFKLNTRLMLAMAVMATTQAVLIGGFAWFNLSRSLDDEIGHRALVVAKTVAAMPSIISGIEQRDMDSLGGITKRLTDENEALFIVVGDRAMIRLAHPNPEKLGKSMADDEGDQGQMALISGIAYVTKAEGSLGPSMRARAPVYDATGEEIIGVVSVGFSLNQIRALISQYAVWLLAVSGGILVLSMGMAMIITRRLKREIFGLEPDEIARSFKEQEATLESVREGIIAINRNGLITTFNSQAIRMVGLSEGSTVLGRPIQSVLPDSALEDIMLSGEAQLDEEVWLNGTQMIVNRIPLKQNDVIVGAVSSFRPRNEVDLVSRQLTRIEQYADTLRSQAHEYSNKLHTIAGLIQLNAKDDALKLIGAESVDQQKILELIVRHIDNPVVAGCLLGKHSRAKEMGLKLEFDPDSQLSELPQTLSADQLVSLLGNLIDNALEATRRHRGSGGEVQLSLTDLGNDLIIEVQDQGPGIPEDQTEQIFTKGFTSKAEGDHGLGLHLVQNIIDHSGGTIHFETLIPNGTRVICYIPKRGGPKP